MILESFSISGIAILIFVLGMIVQKYCFQQSVSEIKPNSFIKTQSITPKVSGVTLDETKVVLKIDTSNLEKKTELVGNTTIMENDTSNAINKLKNMKGR
jgi:hypothetical protein